MCFTIKAKPFRCELLSFELLMLLFNLLFACNVCRGPGRFEGDRPRFGDRDGYRGGPRGAPGDFGGDKSGAPAEFQPSFRVIIFVR